MVVCGVSPEVQPPDDIARIDDFLKTLKEAKQIRWHESARFSVKDSETAAMTLGRQTSVVTGMTSLGAGADRGPRGGSSGTAANVRRGPFPGNAFPQGMPPQMLPTRQMVSVGTSLTVAPAVLNSGDIQVTLAVECSAPNPSAISRPENSPTEEKQAASAAGPEPALDRIQRIKSESTLLLSPQKPQILRAESYTATDPSGSEVILILISADLKHRLPN